MNQLTNNHLSAEMQRVRVVTANYNYLQGLRLVPFGVWLLLNAIIDAGWYLPAWIPDWLIVGTYILGPFVALVLYWLIGRYYNHIFGYVQPMQSASTSKLAWKWNVVIIVSATVWLVSFLQRPSLSISVTGLLLAGMCLINWWQMKSFSTHYFFVAVALGAASGLALLSLWNDVPIASKSLLLVLLALYFILRGIIDHLLLVRTLKPVLGE